MGLRLHRRWIRAQGVSAAPVLGGCLCPGARRPSPPGMPSMAVYTPLRLRMMPLG